MSDPTDGTSKSSLWQEFLVESSLSPREMLGIRKLRAWGMAHGELQELRKLSRTEVDRIFSAEIAKHVVHLSRYMEKEIVARHVALHTTMILAAALARASPVPAEVLVEEFSEILHKFRRAKP